MSERREAEWVTRYFLPSYHSFPSHPALGPKEPPMLGGTGPSVTKGESRRGNGNARRRTVTRREP